MTRTRLRRRRRVACARSPRSVARRNGSPRSVPRRSARTSSFRGRCSTATATCCAPMRRMTAVGVLPAKTADVDPRFFDVLFAYEDKRFPRASRRRSAGARARRGSTPRFRPHSLRRLDADHAGGAAVGAAQRADVRRKTPPDRARRRDRARLAQGSDSFALSQPCALWRQYRRHSRGVAGLFRQGAAASDVGGSGPFGRLAAIAGIAAAGPLCRHSARGARSRPRPLRRNRERACRRDRARQIGTGADGAPHHADPRAACRRRGRRAIAGRA